MEQRVSLITLGVAELERAAAFYEALGWRRVEAPGGIVVFDLIGQALGLYPKADLARDMGLAETEVGGFSGITLAHNLRERAEVAPLYERALAAGARGIRPPHDVFWGGHIAYFADPDGHVWEIAWNPGAPLAADGAFRWEGTP
jgi:hypothetical protein